MATDPGNQKENSPDCKDEPAPDEAGRGDEGSRDGDLVADDSVAVVADHGNQAANVATPSTDVIGTESAGTGDLPGDDDLLGALTSMPSVAMSNIDQTLDQLTNSTDLFDVPALDFYDDLPT